MHFCTFLSIILMILNVQALNNFADITCGQRPNQRKSKIVGGQEAGKAEFPWLVSITRRGNHFCGGTLIDKRHVMTAAHCLCTGIGNDHLKPGNLKITISQHDLSQTNSEAYEMSVKSVIVHPEYMCNKVKNDIAIVELHDEVKWTENVSPACLPANNKEKFNILSDNFKATVAGWGWTNENKNKGGRATILQKAHVNVVEIEKCRDWYKSQGKKTKIQETQICAGHENGGIDACWADSGGPLMVETKTRDQIMVIGVVSTGIGCGRPYLPGIYTRVSEYVPWIRQVVIEKTD
ncbi:hypothetical protein ABEB36_007465 [Hypothenemus hampei]|uniref:Peptidase S1 domain-containing protein n=1 Tax=Hypothenemus hampei TaxID=57062 RepID=A0ABD1EU46_HYPHA